MPCGIDAGRVRWLEFGHHIGLWHGAHYPLPVVANRGFEFLDLFVNRVIGDEAFEYVVLMTGANVQILSTSESNLVVYSNLL